MLLVTLCLFPSFASKKACGNVDHVGSKLGRVVAVNRTCPLFKATVHKMSDIVIFWLRNVKLPNFLFSRRSQSEALLLRGSPVPPRRPGLQLRPWPGRGEPQLGGELGRGRGALEVGPAGSGRLRPRSAMDHRPGQRGGLAQTHTRHARSV